eukprot:1254470-Rhodomonas_salina.1
MTHQVRVCCLYQSARFAASPSQGRVSAALGVSPSSSLSLTCCPVGATSVSGLYSATRKSSPHSSLSPLFVPVRATA